MDLLRQRLGFDPDNTADRIYFLDPKSSSYVVLGKKAYKGIVSGEVRL